MNFTILACDQRSPEWHLARAGRLTSTGAVDMLAKIQKGEAAGRRNLRLKLALERVCGKPIERDFTSQAMLDGIEREAQALAEYESLTAAFVTKTGFLQHADLMAGTSLDGHIGEFDGIVEAKCPEHAAHWEFLKTGDVPYKYRCQITHHLWITGAAWCDFLSFQPDFPESKRVKLVRISNADVDLAGYDTTARAFLAEVDRDTAEIGA